MVHDDAAPGFNLCNRGNLSVLSELLEECVRRDIAVTQYIVVFTTIIYYSLVFTIIIIWTKLMHIDHNPIKLD